MNKETFQRRVNALANADGWEVAFSHNEVQNHAVMTMQGSPVIRFVFFNNVHSEAVYNYTENVQTGNRSSTSRAPGLEIEPEEHWNVRIREAAK